MVDAWEIFGRLATDDTFRAAAFNAPFTTPYSVGANMRAGIPKADYDTALALVRTVMPGRPVSLLALGELAVSLTFPKFRRAIGTLSDAVKATGIAAVGKDSNFYTALGAMIIDDQLRANLQASSQAFQDFGFTSVAPAERSVLQNLFDPATNSGKGVINASDDTCDSFWEPGCHLRMIFWGAHRHPIANP